MSGNRYPKLALIVIVVCLGFSPKVGADTPKVQLQGTIQQVMDVLKTIRSADDIARNQDRLRQIVSTRFDFTEMARRSLGSHWNNLNGKEAEFVAAFMQFIEGAYLGQPRILSR